MTDARKNERSLALGLYATMLRIRHFEEAAEAAQRAGEIPGTLHLSIGQEAVAAGICSALERTDLITSTHRGHGHSIAKGAPLPAMMSELFGRAPGTCKGKGGSMHIADFSVGMLGANGIVGGGLGIAVGAAQGLRVRGSNAVTVCFFGDGAINRGPFLESLNWAAVFCLPVLFVCEDNGFSAFTETVRLTAGTGPVARAEALGIQSMVVDGNDVMAVAAAAAPTVKRLRQGGGPAFIHARTYRLSGHTIADQGGYRDSEKHSRQQLRDPLRLIRQQLTDWNMSADVQRLQKEVEGNVEAALAAARGANFPEPASAFVDVQDVGSPV